MLFTNKRLTTAQSGYLEMWRGGSAVAVMIGHAFQVFTLDPSPVWSMFAAAAVMAFFVLSGFFIHKSLARSFADGARWNFVVARVNRILPPFALAIALTTALWALAPLFFAHADRSYAIPTARPDFSLRYLPSTILFLNGFFGGTLSADGPLWSLSYEVWYYVLAFLAGCIVLRQKWAWIAIPIALALAIRNIQFAILGLVWWTGFFVSILHANDRLPRRPTWFLWALPVLAAPFYLARPSSFSTLLTFDLAFGVAFAMHLLRILEAAALPCNRALRHSASYSYTLYVTHFPLLLFAYGALHERTWLMLPVGLAILALCIAIGPRVERVKFLPVRRESPVGSDVADLNPAFVDVEVHTGVTKAPQSSYRL